VKSEVRLIGRLRRDKERRGAWQSGFARLGIVRRVHTERGGKEGANGLAAQRKIERRAQRKRRERRERNEREEREVR